MAAFSWVSMYTAERLLNPWFDRDLAVAGRVTVLTAQDQLESVLFDSGRAVAVIPSLAIHLDREANKQRSINPQKDVVPLVMLGEPQGFDFKSLARREADGERSAVAGCPRHGL